MSGGWPMLFYALLLPLAPAYGATDKLTCTVKELSRLDCHLRLGTYNIRLLPATIAWSDGTWHTINEMPLKGEAVAWEKVQFQILNKCPILQLWLWDKSVTETQVESLHWYVMAPEKKKMSALSDNIVRKRRLQQAPQPPATPATAPILEHKPSAKYIYDAMDPHSLKTLKEGRLE
jgi:hypothetical protein